MARNNQEPVSQIVPMKTLKDLFRLLIITIKRLLVSPYKHLFYKLLQHYKVARNSCEQTIAERPFLNTAIWPSRGVRLLRSRPKSRCSAGRGSLVCEQLVWLRYNESVSRGNFKRSLFQIDELYVVNFTALILNVSRETYIIGNS